jgi:N-acetylglucosaminyldiphosphoundecaprenol N-acetyl-beta-D-mannosaminyltransferase
LFGIEFDFVTLGEAVDRVERLARERTGGLVVTPNVDFVMKVQVDHAFRRVCQQSPLVLADGMPVVWASRLLGAPLPERVAGSDLFPLACERAAQVGQSVYLLGAREGVAERAARILQDRYPGLQVAGTHSPPLGFDRDAAASARVVELVRAAQPDLLFLALGAPKQELWYDAHRDALGVPVALGVGASIDFIAGEVQRAPSWMRRAGLEWLYRFVQEPRRLFRRYFIDDTKFIVLVAREWRRSRARRAA